MKKEFNNTLHFPRSTPFPFVNNYYHKIQHLKLIWEASLHYSELIENKVK
ncbi:hypothetical protein T11_8101 [Trichinella zimbabwensis]|uniref:Uncharacterized protein n=1 Tax=Trichinella zimbabwensis TaxID=268475 RepID=A0A0V1GGS4_9BILA|nr:hypothetical protein T11_13818 [Trichinella zimbabwensis]KRY97438.1 hypothetical protein T11_8101 [Trichinella zimbabwensis]